MKTTNNKFNLEFTDFCLKNGVKGELFLNKNNIDEYAKTAADAYSNYPLFELTFKGKYDEHTFYRMLKVDFKSRIGKTIGIASENYESVLLIEPPMCKKTGNIQYLQAVDIHSFMLLFSPITARQNSFEKYALRKRAPYIDEKTWYIYLFTTKKEFQRSGFGKKLLNLVVLFAKEFNYKLCLETNLRENIKMYASFGFKLVDTSLYKNTIEHFVMSC